MQHHGLYNCQSPNDAMSFHLHGLYSSPSDDSEDDDYRKLTVLKEGMYVVVALDPVASVRFLDSEAAVAAGALKTKQYLALIKPVNTSLSSWAVCTG